MLSEAEVRHNYSRGIIGLTGCQQLGDVLVGCLHAGYGPYIAMAPYSHGLYVYGLVRRLHAGYGLYSYGLHSHRPIQLWPI